MVATRARSDSPVSSARPNSHLCVAEVEIELGLLAKRIGIASRLAQKKFRATSGFDEVFKKCNMVLASIKAAIKGAPMRTGSNTDCVEVPIEVADRVRKISSSVYCHWMDCQALGQDVHYANTAAVHAGSSSHRAIHNAANAAKHDGLYSQQPKWLSPGSPEKKVLSLCDMLVHGKPPFKDLLHENETAFFNLYEDDDTDIKSELIDREVQTELDRTNSTIAWEPSVLIDVAMINQWKVMHEQLEVRKK